MVKILVNRPRTATTMTLVGSNGHRVSMHSTPPQITYSNVARFGQVEREGQKTITRMVGPGLKQLSFEHTVASLDWTRSIESAMDWFTAKAAVGVKVRFTGATSRLESGVWWNIKDLQVEVVQRAANNDASHVKLSWTLEEAVDYNPSVARRSKPKAKKSTSRSTAARTTTRTHKVKRGDTLWLLAAKYLRNGNRWKEIYALNRSRLPNPNRLTVGLTLKIPGR